MQEWGILVCKGIFLLDPCGALGMSCTCYCIPDLVALALRQMAYALCRCANSCPLRCNCNFGSEGNDNSMYSHYEELNSMHGIIELATYM